jgi:hypothetical protein
LISTTPPQHCYHYLSFLLFLLLLQPHILSPIIWAPTCYLAPCPLGSIQKLDKFSFFITFFSSQLEPMQDSSSHNDDAVPNAVMPAHAGTHQLCKCLNIVSMTGSFLPPPMPHF